MQQSTFAKYFAVLKSKLAGEVGKNISWFTGDKIVKIAIGTVVGSLLARYLGPVKFGDLNYIAAYASIFTPIASFGLTPIIARDIPKEEASTKEILGVSLVLRTIGVIIAIAIGMLWGLASHQLNGNYFLYYILVSVSTIGAVFEGFDVYYQTKLKNKTVVVNRFTAFTIVTIIRIIGLILHADVWFFVAIYALDYLIGGILLYIQAAKEGLRISDLSFSKQRAFSYLKEVTIIILAATLTSYYMRIDKIILLQFHTRFDLGIYAAVTKLSELWFFIPGAIASVYAPILAKRSTIDKEFYMHTFKKQTAMILYITYAICLFTTIFAPILIFVFYGEEFANAVNPLRIHIWSLVFVSLGTAQMAWNSIEKKQTLFLLRALLGAITCLILYYLLIPKYGVMGAAVATTIAYTVPEFFSNLLHPATREVFFIQLSLLIPTPKNIKLLFS